MEKNTTIPIGPRYGAFVEESVAKARYHNSSGITVAGLRLEEDEENRFMLLSRAIREGIDSGIAIDFDVQNHLNELKKRS